MTPLVRFRVALLLLIFPASAQAWTRTAGGFQITVEPIVGYEFSLRDTPTPHRRGMLIYGARFTAGRPHLSAEGEFTHGNDTEAFTTPTIFTDTTSRDAARLGIRGTYDLGTRLGVLARLGGQATRTKVQRADAGGLTTTMDGKWLIKPYVGAGLQYAIAGVLSVSAEATYVFNSLEDFKQNTVQLAGSVRFHLNSR